MLSVTQIKLHSADSPALWNSATCSKILWNCMELRRPRKIVSHTNVMQCAAFGHRKPCLYVVMDLIHFPAVCR